MEVMQINSKVKRDGGSIALNKLLTKELGYDIDTFFEKKNYSIIKNFSLMDGFLDMYEELANKK